MLLDHFIMIIITMVFFIPSMANLYGVPYDTRGTEWIPLLSRPVFYISLIGLAIYFCKDSVNGRSIAKRILKLQVVDNASGRPASPLQCVIRNMFCMLWPVEVIIVLASPSRRLGDIIAGTRVEYYTPGNIEHENFDFKKLVAPFILAYCIILLGALMFSQLSPSHP